MNRTVLSRLYPEAFRHLGVSPLSSWFADLRTALSAVAPQRLSSGHEPSCWDPTRNAQVSSRRRTSQRTSVITWPAAEI